MTIILSLFLFCYTFLLLTYYKGSIRLKNTQAAVNLQKTAVPSTSFTIIIPYRNEAKNLKALLDSLETLNYPTQLFELIFVNDASTDASEILVLNGLQKFKKALNVQNNRISASPKKDAITTAIALATNTWIVTTDADCVVPQNWLATLNTLILDTKPKMICGPVVYKTNASLLQDFQLLDGISLQGIAIGAFGKQKPMLNNGANLAYKKDIFNNLGGFQDNNHIASGDDIFMLEKISKKYPLDVLYLYSREAIISTQPENSWNDLIHQRIRWASKTGQTNNKIALGIGLLVFIINFWFLALPCIALLKPSIWVFTIFYLLFKMCIDTLFIKHTNKFFGVKISALRLLQCGFIYPVITCLVFFKSLQKTYIWKGRTFTK